MSDYRLFSLPLDECCKNCNWGDFISICPGCNKVENRKPNYIVIRFNNKGEMEMDRTVLKEIVSKEIANKIAKYQPFTYWDISQEIHKYLKNAQFGKEEVKDLCNEIYNDGTFPTWYADWSKTLCVLKNKGGQVFVMHPNDVEP